jgi:hypothetical protein
VVLNIPLHITQGTTVEWEESHDDYPASTWTATCIIRSEKTSLVATATASGDDFEFALTATQTAALYPGSYEVQIFVAKGAERYLHDSGYVQILPDLAVSQPLTIKGDSPARQRYNNYVALLLNEAYVKTLDPDQLAALEQAVKRLEWDLKREDDAEKLKRGDNVTRKIYTRFI